ncbi:unnamed protein product [Parnassius apollo]|uniref:(apollo) hypothetical protein n=1 Tax=Parnassius apollo TaxID=110799 RepID=A0A8S3WTR3_PARAO|nr:unnamed protein product [Parnassius apollo]
MKLPIPELKKKLDSLTGSYRREKSKQRKSNITGSGADEIYISKWFGFKYFDFMSNKDDTGITKEGGIDISNLSQQLGPSQQPTPSPQQPELSPQEPTPSPQEPTSSPQELTPSLQEPSPSPQQTLPSSQPSLKLKKDG